MLDFELDNKKDYVKTLWPKKRLPKENLIIYQRKAKCLYRWDESAITTEMGFFFGNRCMPWIFYEKIRKNLILSLLEVTKQKIHKKFEFHYLNPKN